jgi:hypothetical protein
MAPSNVRLHVCTRRLKVGKPPKSPGILGAASRLNPRRSLPFTAQVAFFAQRFCAAFLAISLRGLAVRFSARAFPPWPLAPWVLAVIRRNRLFLKHRLGAALR